MALSFNWPVSGLGPSTSLRNVLEMVSSLEPRIRIPGRAHGVPQSH